ncbi:hypothetical protein K8R78_06630, partial [bacterium]|nr:hypothetical protein [bacterium]
RLVKTVLPEIGVEWYPRVATSPNGRYLTFVSDNPIQGVGGEWDFTEEFGDGSQLFLYDMKEEELRLLAQDGYAVDRPAFSPDGKLIAFDQYGADGDWDIAIVEISSGEVSLVASSNFVEEAASFTPDGESIVYSSSRVDDTHHLFLTNLASGETRQLTEQGSYNGDPDISAFGQLVYSSERNGEVDLYLMNLSGDRNAVLVAELPGEQYFPRFSPDGDFIAFTTYDDTGGSDIYLIDSNGWGPPVRVTNTHSLETCADWITYK